MTYATTMRDPQSAARRLDPWDEEALGDDDWGPSWTKAYVGGMKVRQYVVSTAAAYVSAAQQPTT